MSTFGTGSTTTAGASITLRNFTGTNGLQAGTDGLVPGPGIAQAGYILGAGGDWTLEILGNIPLAESSNRIATTEFVQDVVGEAILGGNAQLSQLIDVTIAGLADDQFLQYNAGNGKWENTTLSLGLISDVNLAGIADGNALVYDANANQWVPGLGGGGGANNLDGLGDVTIAGVAVNHFLVNNGAGQFVNRVIETVDLDDEAEIVLTTRGATLGAFDYDFTGSNSITVPAPQNQADATTKAYVDTELAGKQPLEATLTGLALIAPVDNDLIIATGNDTFGVINTSANVQTFLAGTGSVGDLSDVSTAGAVNGKILKYNNGSFEIADETDTQLSDEEVQDIVGGMVAGNTETGITVSYQDNGALAGKIDFVVDNTVVGFLAGAQDFTGDKTFSGSLTTTGDTDLTGANFVRIPAPVVGADATTKTYVDTQVDTKQTSNARLDDISGLGVNANHFIVGDGNNLTLSTSTDAITSLGLSVTVNQLLIGDGVNTFTTIATTAGGRSFLASDASIGELSNVTLGGVGLANGQTLRYNNGVWENLKLDLTDLDGTGSIVKTDAGATFGAFTYDFTGSTITVPSPNADTHASTKKYVDDEVATKQPLEATLTGLALSAPVENDLIIATGADTFGVINTTQGVQDFLASNGDLDGLGDVTIAGGLGQLLADGQTLRYDGANQVWKNSPLQFNDLSQVGNVAQLNQNQTFTGDNTFTGGLVLTNASITGTVNLTGATATATTQPEGTDNLTLATTAFVQQEMAEAGIVADLDDLNDVTLGGVALAEGQVLRVSNDNSTLVNAVLDYSDLSGTPVVGVDLQEYNDTLQGISALQPVPASRYLYTTNADTFAEGTINQVGIDILASANAGSVRTVISAQELDATLTALADLDTVADQIIYSTDVDAFAMTSLTANARTFLGTDTGISDLSDVLVAGVANAQVLVYDADGGANDNQWKNVSISGDITINNAGVATIGALAVEEGMIANNAITVNKIADSEVSNAKLENSYVAISDGTTTDNLPLGQTFTFNATANETTVVVSADAGAGADGAEITIGLPADVTIANDLTVSRNLEVSGDLVVSGTTTTISTEQLTIEDPVVVLNANDSAKDVGHFFTNPGASGDQIFIFDNADQIFKMAQVPAGKGAGDGEDSDFNPTVYSGLKIGALTSTTGTFIGLLNADAGIEVDNGGVKFSVSDAGAVVSVGGITDTTVASAFATGTTIGDLTLSNGSITSGGGEISFGDENISFSGDLAVNTNKLTIDGATGNTLIAGTLEVSDTATFTVASVFTAGLSANDQNITNVADIALDSISAEGDAIAISLADNVPSALVVREAGNDYITVDTTIGAELITFEKDVIFNGSTNISLDQATTINDSGNAVDFRVEGDNQEYLLYTNGTNDRVGINTDNPSSQFHVVGNSTFAGDLTQGDGHVVFNNGLGSFDFRVAGDNQANLLFVDASADSIGVGTNSPSKTLDVVGNVGISTTLNVTGKTTLADSLDLSTGSTTGITFRSEVQADGADGDQTLLRVNIGANGGVAGVNPLYKSIKWVANDDRFSVESSLKSEGNFTVGADQLTVDASNGNTSIVGTLGVSETTTLNNVGGTSDLIVQNNGADVLNVDVSEGTTTITGQLKTDDLRASTAGTDKFKVVLEDGIANALEFYDDSIANESYLLFNTQLEKIGFGKEANFNSRAKFTTSVDLESGVNSGVKYNSNLENAVSADATLMTIEGGTDKSNVVLRWDTSEDEINLNAEAGIHLQGKAVDNALTIGGATGANANITMTTEGAITLDGTLDSPTINTDKITDRTANGLEIELADATESALVLRQGELGESYLTIDTDAKTVSINEDASFDATVSITGDTTLDASLKIKYIDGLTTPLILANSDRTGNGEEADALLIEVERGAESNAKIKWDETSNVFEFDKTLSAEANFQVGTDASNPTATINSASGDLSTEGSISATSTITTDATVNFTTSSQGAVVFNSDLGGVANPLATDDFGITVNRGALTDSKLYWDESATSWQFETGNVQVQNTLVVDSDANGKISISNGQITSESGEISFDDENLTTTGSITSATPVLATNNTTVATTAFVKGQKIGDFDEVDTTGFNTNDQVLVWDQDNGTFKAGDAIYNAENARDDVGTALANGSHTGAETITFTNDDQNEVINLALGITSRNLTDVQDIAPQDTQVLRYVAGNNQYEPTTLGTSADVDTGLEDGEIPTLTAHYLPSQNEIADLIIKGRLLESIDYGSITEEFDANNDHTIDFNGTGLTDTSLYCAEDYGVLVV